VCHFVIVGSEGLRKLGVPGPELAEHVLFKAQVINFVVIMQSQLIVFDNSWCYITCYIQYYSSVYHMTIYYKACYVQFYIIKIYNTYL
jgi:hypothetical protein